MTYASQSESSKARRRLRENARNNGMEYRVLKTPGMTVEQKIAHWSGPMKPNGCVPWLGAKGTPVLRFGGKAHPVRVLLWEKREGRKLPPGCVVSTTCGDGSCIGDAHLNMMPRGKCLHSPRAQEKAVQLRRSRYGKNREAALRAAMEHVPSVRSTLRHRFGDRIDIEDVLQDSLLDVYLASLKTGYVIQDAGALLRQTAINHAIDIVRRRSFVAIVHCDPQNPVLLHHVAPDEADPARQYEIALTTYRSRKRLHAHMRKVPERARQALRLQQQYGLSQDEIAARMGISENTVEQHLRKARALIQPGKHTSFRNTL